MGSHLKSNHLIITSIFILFTACIYSTAHAVPVLSFDVSNSTPETGDTITTDIIATDVTDLFTFNIDIAFNSSVLGVSSVSPGSFLGGGGLTLGDIGLFGFDTSTLGEVQNMNDSLLGPVAGVTGDGVLATIVFDVLGTGTSTLSFLGVNALAGTELINSSGLSINIFNTQDATISVPEPGTILLMGIGISGVFAFKRRAPAKGRQRQQRNG